MTGEPVFRDTVSEDTGGDRSAGDRGRHREKVREAVREGIGDILGEENIIGRSGRDIIKVPIRGVKEYRFVHGSPQDGVAQGDGTQEEGQVVGKSGKGDQPGDKAGDKAGGDVYETEIQLDELIEIAFEDLELPDMERRRLRQVVVRTTTRRVGYKRAGIPSQLDKRRTARERIRRMIGQQSAVSAIEEEIVECIVNSRHAEALGDAKEAERLMQKVEELGAVLERQYAITPQIEGGESYQKHLEDHPEDAFPFHDTDQRFHRRKENPQTESNAVVICIMDTSGSMDTQKKYLARMFFWLLFNFVKTRYVNVDLVFVAHHTEAKEVTEEQFFHKSESGGTFISSGYEKALEIIQERYHPSLWNVYAFHCSDGDNFDSDNPKAIRTAGQLIKISNLFGYVEIKPLGERYYGSSMLNTFRPLAENNPNYHAITIEGKDDVWPQFREIMKSDERRNG